MTQPKLELTWIGKSHRPKLEPRILLEDPAKSYHAATRVTDHDQFDNRLIFGDNLLALRALEAEFTGKIKCVFIDPPYNTGSAFTHYDDGLEHSIWLGLMRDRLEIIRRLLADDGSLWITIDDNECHYLKVLCDELFGRQNFVANTLWQKVYSERMDAKEFSTTHDHILVYKKGDQFKPVKLRVEQNDKQFNLFDAKTGKFYRRRSLRKEGSNSRREDRPNLWYPIEAPDGSLVYPIRPATNTEGNWRWSKDTFIKNQDLGIVEWVETPRGWEVYVKQYKEDDATRPPNTWWSCEDVGHNHEAKEEARQFNRVDVFSTPKPERLLERIIHIATNAGDWVLDSFAGSGTTGAVAHKMGRKWIMVELGDHCHTHIIPRLQKVIDGTDQGGISKAVDWAGGGGFRYYKLAPSLLERDRWGNFTINPDYNAAMMSEALCKQHGYTYAPSETVFWQQGYATERSFLYATTQNLSFEQLQALAEEVGEHRSLLIIAAAWRGISGEEASRRWPNLTLKKIPNSILHLCEWGKDDYSLNVANLPMAQPEPEQSATKSSTKAANPQQASLFGEGE